MCPQGLCFACSSFFFRSALNSPTLGTRLRLRQPASPRAVPREGRSWLLTAFDSSHSPTLFCLLPHLRHLTAGMSRTTDPAYLLETLANLRLALPSTLLLILAVRYIANAFLQMMDRIQSQGWVPLPEDLERAPADGGGGEGPELEEDAIRPVVVKVRSLRRGLVLGLFACVAGSYFMDGAAQGESFRFSGGRRNGADDEPELKVIATLITNVFTPQLPLYRNVIQYSAGGVAAFALCALSMAFEDKAKGGAGNWGRVYPRAIAGVALALEIAIAGISARLLQQGELLRLRRR